MTTDRESDSFKLSGEPRGDGIWTSSARLP